MESCLAVELDLLKAIPRFSALGEHSEQIIDESIEELQKLQNELAKIPPGTQLSASQAEVVKETTQRLKDTAQQLATGYHRYLHAYVSRVGKSIDSNFIADFTAVAPKADSFCSDANRPIMEQAIAQHFYRQGLDEVADVFVTEAGVEGVDRRSPFAAIEKIAASLSAGETEEALQWVARRQDELTHSPLPFTLHVMHALKLAREVNVSAAIEYAREHFPVHAARHEKQLQAAVCALAWCAPPPAGQTPPPLPHQYKHLLSTKAYGATAADMFVREACALLQLAPLSALAGAVRAGCRVLPALHDIRSKVTQPHVIAAWADDDLPLEVDLGEDGGFYHSVFSCPILRQQASEQNPPMRLHCGHVISRDALNKLAQGVKLKCPYCPMEQSPSEARQIYFS